MKEKLIFILMVLISLFFAADALAVTYRNDSSEVKIVQDSDGRPVFLDPGKSFVTDRYVDLSLPENTGLKKVSDTPFFKIAIATDSVTGTVEGTAVDVDLAANFMIIGVSSGIVNIFSQSTENTPAILTDFSSDDGKFQMKLSGKFDQLVVTGTGTCRITQYKIDEF